VHLFFYISAPCRAANFPYSPFPFTLVSRVLKIKHSRCVLDHSGDIIPHVKMHVFLLHVSDNISGYMTLLPLLLLLFPLLLLPYNGGNLELL
jgi:hypothetical protein